MHLLISSAMLAELQRLTVAAAPQEICGILFGREDAVRACRAARNRAVDPVRHFEIDPAILIAAEREARSGGPPILGYYHSHPTGSVQPSHTDAQNAAPDGRLWLILNGRDARVWRAVPEGEIYGRFDAIKLDCLDATGQTAANRKHR